MLVLIIVSYIIVEVNSNITSKPTFSHNGNTLSMYCATGGASIYYTTDGSTPTDSSTLYTGPIAMTQNCTVKAIAVADGYENSEVATYVVNWFDLTPSSFTITFDDVNVANGAGKLVVNMTKSITIAGWQMYLYLPEGIEIIMKDGEYDITLSSTFHEAKHSCSVKKTSDGAYMLICTGGTETVALKEAESGELCTIGLKVADGVTSQAVAVKNVAVSDDQGDQYNQADTTFLLIVGDSGIKENAASPTFSLSSNQLTITTTTENASIYYTTDGSTPTKSSTLYTEPITLTQNCTIKAIAVADGYENSEVATYVVNWFDLPESSLVYVNPSEMGLSTSSTIYLNTGAAIGSNSVMDVFVACPDDYYAAGVLRDDMFYYPYFYFNGEEVSRYNGIWGQTNPKDADGKTPGQSLKVPTTGTAFAMKAKKDGYMYVWGVYSTSKYYSLFEDSVAVGYRLAMITNGWYREGDTSTLGHGRVDIQFGQYNQKFERAIPSISTAITNDTTNVVNVYGEGVMIFPVKENSTYIINGNGCKFIFGGVHFNEQQESLIQLGSESGPEYTLLKSGDKPLYTYDEKPLCPSPVYEIDKDKSQLSITCSVLNATIYYTVDGSTPTTQSLRYSDPIEFNSNCIVKSIAVAEGYANSELSTYIVNWFSSLEEDHIKYEVTFNGEDIEYHDGVKVEIPTYFTFGEGDSKHNFNKKFQCSYEGMEYTSGLKMESTTLIKFTTKSVSKVTIVQSTWSDYTIKFDDSELDISNTQTGNGCRIYTIDNILVGDHAITRGSGESGLFYVSVENLGLPIQPYAILTPDSTSVLSSDSMGVTYGQTLTFYYDDQKEARNGMSVGLFETSDERGWEAESTAITEVVFDASMKEYDGLTSTLGWFSRFSNLTTITGLENLNTTNVTSMKGMFDQCSSLTNLDLSSFNTENVTDMMGMFVHCTSLTSIDLSSFNTAKVEDMRYMFQACSALQTIYVGDGWSTGSVTNKGTNIFIGCTSLVGGQGTTYDSEHVDATYAQIDGGPSNPSYLTLKLAMGDANGDGYVNIADAVATVTNILGVPTAEDFYQYAADMNNDQVIDIFDVTLIVNAAFDAASPAPVMTRGSSGNIMMEHISMTADADDIYLGIDQPERFTAMQFDVTLPEGTELVHVRLASATTDHQLSFVKRGENEYRVIGLSLSNATFHSLDGQLLKLQTSGSAVDSDVKMSNVLFVTPSNKTVTGIEAVQRSTFNVQLSTCYDLKGQKLVKGKQQLGKGIYIENGRKVIIK